MATVPVKLPLILDYGVGGFAVMFGVPTVKFVLLSIVMAYFFNRAGAATLTTVAGHGLPNDSMGVGGVIASEAFADRVTYELLLIAPMAVVALVMITATRGRLGVSGSAVASDLPSSHPVQRRTGTAPGA